jgi:hypothetical protein
MGADARVSGLFVRLEGGHQMTQEQPRFPAEL